MSEIGRIEIYPVRLIPFDAGYRINDANKNKLIKIFNEECYAIKKEIQLFGINALLYVEVNAEISLYLFEDGIGVFVYKDVKECIKSLNRISAEKSLSLRRDAHKRLLTQKHRISSTLTKVTEIVRNIVKEKNRRFTATDSWESGGFSYVFSMYFLNKSINSIENPKVQDWMFNLLFPDRHTYLGEVSSSFNANDVQQALDNIDVFSDVHACISWASLIVVGELSDERMKYYVDLEIVLQHIWLYAYITNQIVDSYIEKAGKSISSKQLTVFYDTLVDMTMIVKRYDNLVDSVVHEREVSMLNTMALSSKLNNLKIGLEEKSEVLEKKLSWAIGQKRLRSDRNTELFVIVLTILQVASGFGIENVFDLKFFPFFIILLVVLIVFRLRD